MRSLTAAIISTLAAADGYDEEFTHNHYIEGEEYELRDIEVIYDEIEYTIITKLDHEVRTRQVPVNTYCEHLETKYREEEETRYTTEYQINYRPNTYQRHTFEPRTVIGHYTETHYRDVPYTT